MIHPHGYIPRAGPISRQDIVFTEPDYHKLTESVFHWGLSEIVDRLRKNTVLFIGLSMSDPSLRRLLDASRNSGIPPHWQIQKRHEIRDHEFLEVMAEVERRAREYAKLLGNGFDEQKKPSQLEESIRAALHRRIHMTGRFSRAWVSRQFGWIASMTFQASSVPSLPRALAQAWIILGSVCKNGFSTAAGGPKCGWP